jgi:deazaflavin-dependent oxidoreductase (nitroreductase family)
MSINGLIVNLLGSRLHRLLDRSLVGVRIVGRRTGRRYEIPVQYAREPGTDFVVYPANFSRKRWWRNFLTPAHVDVLVGGQWEPASARVVRASDHDYAASLGVYARQWAMMPAAGAPLVVISPT